MRAVVGPKATTVPGIHSCQRRRRNAGKICSTRAAGLPAGKAGLSRSPEVVSSPQALVLAQCEVQCLTGRLMSSSGWASDGRSTCKLSKTLAGLHRPYSAMIAAPTRCQTYGGAPWPD